MSYKTEPLFQHIVKVASWRIIHGPGIMMNNNDLQPFQGKFAWPCTRSSTITGYSAHRDLSETRSSLWIRIAGDIFDLVSIMVAREITPASQIFKWLLTSNTHVHTLHVLYKIGVIKVVWIFHDQQWVNCSYIWSKWLRPPTYCL